MEENEIRFVPPSGDLNEENLARENWNRKNNKQRKSSYLVPNPH